MSHPVWLCAERAAPGCARALRIALICLAICASPSWAARFTADATILCPGNVVSSGEPVIDTAFPANVTLEPCSGLRVVVLDAMLGRDGYCGAGYTDSRGHVSIGADCAGTSPNAYLVVSGRSVLGFSVGASNFAYWGGLKQAGSSAPLNLDPYVIYQSSHLSFGWLSEARRVVSDHVDWGTLQTGDPSHAEERVSWFAARQFWATQYAMHRLLATTRSAPMDFSYTVDAPLGYPTTLWNTVIVDGDKSLRRPSDMLLATPHEVGHVIYNTRHSDFWHWLSDVTDYMDTHAYCEGGHFMTMAWYEGFANWVRHVAYGRHEWTTNRLTLPASTGICPDVPGFNREGNVTAVLDALYFGPLTDREPMDARMFSCPTGFVRLQEAGTGVVRCERTAAATCAAGRSLRIDGAGGRDDACTTPGREQVSADLYSRLMAACRTKPENCRRDVEAYVLTSCPADMQVRRHGGRDDCLQVRGADSAFLGRGPLPRGDGTPDHILAATPGGAKMWFELMDADTILDFVGNAGTRSHRMEEMWSGWMSPWCRAMDGQGLPRFCNAVQSPRFESIVKDAAVAFPR